MFKDMLPDWKDVTDVRDAMLYYLGFSEQRPMFRRFSYAEKAEYWALVWGTFVMAATGMMAWFKVLHRRTGPGMVDRRRALRSTGTRRCWPRWQSSCGISTR